MSSRWNYATTATDSCEHDVSVRAILDALFPERTASWRTMVHHGENNAKKQCRRQRRPPPSDPVDIRNRVYWALPNFFSKSDNMDKLFGHNTIKLTLTSSLSGKESVKIDSEMTPEDNLTMTNELLYALRTVLANQRPHHEPPKEARENKRTPMDHATCKRRVLPVFAIRLSKRYCYHTVYWLCETLSLMCTSFRLICQQPFPYVPLRDIESVIKPTDEHKLNYRKASRVLRRKFLTFRKRTSFPRCQTCVRWIFVRLNVWLRSLFRHLDRVETILIASYFVCTYRKFMSECTEFDTCDAHRTERYDDGCRTLTVNMNGVIFDSRREYDPSRVCCDRHDFTSRSRGFAKALSLALPLRCDFDDVLEITANENLFGQSCRVLLFMVLLLKESLILEFTYDFETKENDAIPSSHFRLSRV